MRPSALCAVFLLAGIACAQEAPVIEDLIKQLASADYRKRDAAMKALWERPDAEGPIRAAMQSKDAELAARATRLVEQLEYCRSGFRELDKAIDDGQVERAIELIVAWPEAKTDIAFWERIERLYYNLTVNKRYKGPLSHRTNFCLKERARLARYSEADAPVQKGRCIDMDQMRLLRVGEADFDESRLKGDHRGIFRPLLFSSGPVRIKTQVMHGLVVFSTGDVQLRGDAVMNSVIVCGGNVTLEASVDTCLVISKGAVNALKSGGSNTQIISGKTVARENSSFSDIDIDAKITENEANPLGYIRWRKEAKPALEKK